MINLILTAILPLLTIATATAFLNGFIPFIPCLILSTAFVYAEYQALKKLNK